MIFLIGLVLFEYKGAIFWKMTAGMGDVVIAPLYQVLRKRGVEFEFFHRLDALHLDDRTSADRRDHHGPPGPARRRRRPLRTADQGARPPRLSRALPLADQTRPASPDCDRHRWRSHFGERDDVETRVLRRGVDFDHVVLAVSMGMLPIVAEELIEDRPEWREMTTHVRTVATQAFQLWLRPDEPALGWHEPGVTISAYVRAVRDVGVDAADAVGRGLARRRPARHRRVLLRQPRRRRGRRRTVDADYVAPLPGAGACAKPPTTSTDNLGLYLPEGVHRAAASPGIC